MHATETVGAATVICSDKTGTLTLNQMRVRDAHFPALGTRQLTHELETETERLIVEAMSANSTANLSRLPGRAGARRSATRPKARCCSGCTSAASTTSSIAALFRWTSQLTFSPERKYMGTLGRPP